MKILIIWQAPALQTSALDSISEARITKHLMNLQKIEQVL